MQNQEIQCQWSAWRFKCKKWGVVLNVGLQQGEVVNVGVKFKRRWTLCHYGQVIVRFKCRWTLWRVGHVPSHPCNRPLTFRPNFFASEGHSLPHFFSHSHRRIGSSVGFEQIRLNRVTSEQGPRNAEDMASKT